MQITSKKVSVMFENTGDTFWKTKRGKQINTLVVSKKPLASDKFLSIESIHARTILRPHINNTREKIGGRTGGLKFFVVTMERKKQTNRNERFSKSAEKRDESKPMKRTDNVSFLLLFVCLILSRCVEALTRLEKRKSLAATRLVRVSKRMEGSHAQWQARQG